MRIYSVTFITLKTITVNIIYLLAALVTLYSPVSAASDSPVEAHGLCENHLAFSPEMLHSSEVIDFCSSFSGKLLLVVNTASQCGFTPQFDGLEKLYKKYRDQGLEIVGFPSNDFKQELKSEEDVASVCYLNYGVTFPMVAVSSVKGDEVNDFYQWLSDQSGRQPGWNFNKYLVDKDGEIKAFYGAFSKPLGGKLERAIKRELNDLNG